MNENNENGYEHLIKGFLGEPINLAVPKITMASLNELFKMYPADFTNIHEMTYKELLEKINKIKGE